MPETLDQELVVAKFAVAMSENREHVVPELIQNQKRTVSKLQASDFQKDGTEYPFMCHSSRQ